MNIDEFVNRKLTKTGEMPNGDNIYFITEKSVNSIKEQLRIGGVMLSLPNYEEIEKKAEFRQRPRKVDNDPKEEFILGFMQGADWIKKLATGNEA